MMTQHLQRTVAERSSSRSQRKERVAKVEEEEEGYWMPAAASGLARERGRERRGVEGGGGEVLEGRVRVKGLKIRAFCRLEMMKRTENTLPYQFISRVYLFIFLYNLTALYNIVLGTFRNKYMKDLVLLNL